MRFYKMLKSNTSRALSGGWGRAIGISLIMWLSTILLGLLEFGVRSIAQIPDFVDPAMTSGYAFDDLANTAWVSLLISGMVFLMDFLIGAPLLQGANRWYYRRTGGEDDSFSEVFSYFESAQQFFHALGLRLQIWVRMLLWSVLLLLPIIAGSFFWGLYQRPGMEAPPREALLLGGLLAIVWGILSLIAMAFLRLRYLLAPYLLVEHPEWRTGACIKQAVQLVKGYKAELFGFYLSFILWYLPGLIGVILAIVLPFLNAFAAFSAMGWMAVLLGVQVLMCIYLIPYLAGASAMYARYLIEHSAHEQEIQDDATREYDCQEP